jgi:hypothetical protein
LAWGEEGVGGEGGAEVDGVGSHRVSGWGVMGMSDDFWVGVGGDSQGGFGLLFLFDGFVLNGLRATEDIILFKVCSKR